MAANDYYQGSQPPRTYSASPASRYDPRHAPSPAATPAPSYRTTATSSQPPYPAQYGGTPAPYSSTAYQGHQPNSSPFETIFDDHVYPMNSRADTGGANSGDMSQQAYYPSDSGYYGQNRPVAETSDIPLQDHPGKDAPSPIEPDANDHVYDDPNGGRSRRRKKPQKVAFGQLGMFGSDKKRIPWVTYIFTIAQAAVFIAEIARNAVLTGSPIMTKPQFNYFIGPSPQVLINMGARYTLCMHNVDEIQGSTTQINFPCPNATDFSSVEQSCPLSVLCGFDGSVPDPEFNGDKDQSPEPNQWYRFIIPIFMHAGLVHIAFNFLLQLTLGREMEQAVGPIRYFLVYMSAGIFGFVLGGNFDQPLSPSTGASGALFGIIALVLLDLLYSWADRRNPVKDLIFVIVVVLISFVLGLLPGMDNFAHIGGFLMGLLLGVCVLHSPNSLRKKIGQDVSYDPVPGTVAGPQAFFKNPGGFFKGRKPLWWVWWFVRVAAAILTAVVFIVLLNNFYVTESDCDWCKYLSCIVGILCVPEAKYLLTCWQPVNDWCEMGAIKLEEQNP